MESQIVLDDAQSNDEIYFNKPSLVLRIKSIFVDSLVIIVLMMIAYKIVTLLNVDSGMVRGIILGSILLYEPILTSVNRTVGQKMMGLRVRIYSSLKNSKQPQNINIGCSLLRFLVKTLLGWISLLTIHSNSYGKAIHDSVANSVMTLEKKKILKQFIKLQLISSNI